MRFATFSHKPLIIHVKRLNTVVKWIQRNPKKLVYPFLQSSPVHLRLISDAAFKKEETKGHALRGSLYLVATGGDEESFMRASSIHVVEQMTKGLRHVTRSTFAAELFAGCDTVDLGILILTLLDELEYGARSCSEQRKLRENGGHVVPMTLQVDAQSVYAAITALFIKAPAEKSLLSHVQYMRAIRFRHSTPNSLGLHP